MIERLRYRIVGSVLAWDLLVTLAVFYFASLLRPQLPFGNDLSLAQTAPSLWIAALIVVIWVAIFALLTPQRALFTRSMLEAVGRLIAAVVLATITFAGLIYLLGLNFSRVQFLSFAALDLVGLLGVHLIIRATSRANARKAQLRRALIVGGGSAVEQLATEIARRPWAGLAVIGYAADEPEASSGLRHLGKVEATLELITREAIDEVIFALPLAQQDRVAELSLQLLSTPVQIHVLPNVLDLAFPRIPVQTVGGIPLISLRESALSEGQRLLKRLFDIAASSALLLLLAPVMLTIAYLIRRNSDGPVFFRQERVGENGRRFKMIKFRSMYMDAEQRWREVARYDDEGRLIHKIANDPRITPIGAKLRKTSLDELPQLINVLKGEMSLVGPRPEMPYIAADYEPWQWERVRVPPGITGWWQVNGRSDKPMHYNTEYDLYYVQNYSFWLDIQILFRTIWVVFKKDGAF